MFGERSVGAWNPSLRFDYVCALFCLHFARFEKFNNAQLFYVSMTFCQRFTMSEVGRSHFAWTCHGIFCKTRPDFCFFASCKGGLCSLKHHGRYLFHLYQIIHTGHIRSSCMTVKSTPYFFHYTRIRITWSKTGISLPNILLKQL